MCGRCVGECVRVCMNNAVVETAGNSGCRRLERSLGIVEWGPMGSVRVILGDGDGPLLVRGRPTRHHTNM